MILIEEGKSKELINGLCIDLDCVNPRCTRPYKGYVDGGGIHQKPSGSIYELWCSHCDTKWRIKVTLTGDEDHFKIERINFGDLHSWAKKE